MLIHLQKGLLICSFAIIIALSAAFMTDALLTGTYHSGDLVRIDVGGGNTDLQSAVSSDDLFGKPNVQPSQVSVPVGHDSSDIWVSVDGIEGWMSSMLQNNGLCGSAQTTGYSTQITKGHYANEIEVSVGGQAMSLQDAIDTGQFCYSYSYGSWTNPAWSGTCGPVSRTNTRTCIREPDQESVTCSFCLDYVGDSTGCSKSETTRLGDCCGTFSHLGCSGGDVVRIDNCGKVMGVDHTCGQNAGCQDGSCYCTNPVSYQNCYNGWTDGCETDVKYDSSNCGGCGIVCQSGKWCENGRCNWRP